MAECARCRALEEQVVDLQVQVRALRRTIDDLTGLKTRDDPYEDELAPTWSWEKDDRP